MPQKLIINKKLEIGPKTTFAIAPIPTIVIATKTKLDKQQKTKVEIGPKSTFVIAPIPTTVIATKTDKEEKQKLKLARKRLLLSLQIQTQDLPRIAI